MKLAVVAALQYSACNVKLNILYFFELSLLPLLHVPRVGPRDVSTSKWLSK